VKKFALEIREAGSFELQKPDDKILARKRGSSHIYFAETSEELTSLMHLYASRNKILRPSNLEDVFLFLTESSQSESSKFRNG
jgi:hypothetical protein